MFLYKKTYCMQSNCYYCSTNVSNGVNYNSNVYCSEKCVDMVIKVCDYCGDCCNTKEHKGGVYYNPYWFCSQRHYEFSNARIKFGVIGGPIGGHSGKPSGLPIGIRPKETKPSSPPAPTLMPPPGLQVPKPKPPMTNKPVQAHTQYKAPTLPMPPMIGMMVMPTGFKRAPSPPMFVPVYQPPPVLRPVYACYGVPYFTVHI